jgi:hypothetical protein
MLFDEADQIILVREFGQRSSGDFRKWKLEVDSFWNPCAPVEAAVKITPDLCVFVAVKTANRVLFQEIVFQESASNTFARHTDLCGYKFVFVVHRIGWSINAARSMIQMQVTLTDVLGCSSAFAFKQVLATRAFVWYGPTTEHVSERNGGFDWAFDCTGWKILGVHGSPPFLSTTV